MTLHISRQLICIETVLIVSLSVLHLETEEVAAFFLAHRTLLGCWDDGCHLSVCPTACISGGLVWWFPCLLPLLKLVVHLLGYCGLGPHCQPLARQPTVRDCSLWGYKDLVICPNLGISEGRLQLQDCLRGLSRLSLGLCCSCPVLLLPPPPSRC